MTVHPEYPYFLDIRDPDLGREALEAGRGGGTGTSRQRAAGDQGGTEGLRGWQRSVRSSASAWNGWPPRRRMRSTPRTFRKSGDWSDAVRGGLHRPRKEAITIRLDADVLAWFREHVQSGRGYQTEINRVLRKHVRNAAKGGKTL